MSKINKMDDIVRKAVEVGASDARPIDAQDIVLDERVTLKCRVPLCPDYGRNLMCPPNVPSMDDFRRILSRYRVAILVQVRTPVPAHGQGHPDWFAGARALHQIVNRLESHCFSLGLRFAAGFIGGSCRLCSDCPGPGNACHHAFQARPSMEAIGIDVVATAERAGLPLGFPVRDEVVWTGLVLLE
jgi:predicted metal-binding protein